MVSENQRPFVHTYDSQRFLKWLWKHFFSLSQFQKNKFNRSLLKRHGFYRKKNLKILEVGFGYGNLLISFDRSAACFGVELSRRVITNLQTYCKILRRDNITLSTDIGAFLEQGMQFDLIIMSHVLEHIEHEEEALSQCYEMLVPGGTLFLNVPINEPVGYDPKHFRTYLPDVLEAKLASAGFVIVDSQSVFRFGQFYILKLRYKNRFLSKPLEVFYNVLPASVNIFLDKLFLRKYAFSQFICVARKGI